MTESRPGSRRVADSEVVFARPMTHHDANGLGNVHGGVIMMEVDTAAGTCAARHAGRPAVTAAIDELSFMGPVHVGEILVVRARVNVVGRTSMEVGVRVEAQSWDGRETRHTTSAYLVFVALGPDGTPSTDPVPELEFTTDEERRRAAEAAIRRQSRLERRRLVEESRGTSA